MTFSASPMGENVPVIIIGAGPAGLFAASQAALHGHRPVLIDSLRKPGGQCGALWPDEIAADIPGFEPQSARDLIAELERRLEPFDPLFLGSRRATALWGSLESGFNVETNTGETVTGGAVISATGRGALRPRRLTARGISNVTARDLSYEGAADAAGRHVAVTGEGEAAISAALSAAENAASVTLIHPAPLTLSEDHLSILREAVNAERIAILDGEISAVESENGRLSGLEISGRGDVFSRRFDLLLVRNGLEFAEGGVTGLGPVRDASTGETTTPGVFIIGDAANPHAPEIATGFTQAIRAADAAHKRLSPAPRQFAATAFQTA